MKSPTSVMKPLASCSPIMADLARPKSQILRSQLALRRRLDGLWEGWRRSVSHATSPWESGSHRRLWTLHSLQVTVQHPGYGQVESKHPGQSLATSPEGSKGLGGRLMTLRDPQSHSRRCVKSFQASQCLVDAVSHRQCCEVFRCNRGQRQPAIRFAAPASWATKQSTHKYWQSGESGRVHVGEEANQ